MASTVWKGYISFGLISIPVRLFAAAGDEKISFNQIHKVCHGRIKQQVFCPQCDRIVERSELLKGYEVAKDQYVIIDDEDIKKVAPPSSETMEIIQFVKLDEIDPLYFDSSYYSVPEEPGRKAYTLLLKTMEKGNYVALAKVSMHQREFTVAIRPYGNGLTLHTMFYANEVRKLEEYGQTDTVEVKPAEVSLAEKLVEALAEPFQPEKFHDEYQAKLTHLIEEKREGKAVTPTVGKKLAPVIDLMAALQKSLAEGPQRKPASSEVLQMPGANATEAPEAKPKRKRAGGK